MHGFPFIFHDFFGGVEAWQAMHGFPCFFQYFFSGVGSPESLKMHAVPRIFNDFFSGVRSVGRPESLSMHRFVYIFMISSVEWEACEAKIIENDGYPTFSRPPKRSEKRRKLRNIKNT